MAKLTNSHKVITQWTPMHVLSGVMMQKQGWSVGHAAMVSLGFEILENTVGVKMGITAPEGSNNMAMDIVFNMFGYYLGKKI